jgi:uncharacterized protein (DUF1778 family)
MNERKSEVVNLRMSPRVKELLRRAAAHERRTLSNMLEVLIEDYCETKGLVLENNQTAEVQATATPH